MTLSISPGPGADLVDQLAGLDPGSPIHRVRHRRDKVALATQGSYDALFDPALPGLSLVERLLVALYACRLTPAMGLAGHYRERAQAAGPMRRRWPRSRPAILISSLNPACARCSPSPVRSS